MKIYFSGGIFMASALSVNKVIKCLNETENIMKKAIEDKKSIGKIQPDKLLKPFLPKNNSPYSKRTPTENVFSKLKSLMITVLIYLKDDKDRAKRLWEQGLNECIRICKAAGRGPRVGDNRVIKIMEELRDVFENAKPKDDDKSEDNPVKLSKTRNEKFREIVNNFRNFREDVRKNYKIESYNDSCNKGKVLLPIFLNYFPKKRYENSKKAFSRYIMKLRDLILNLDNDIYSLRGGGKDFDEYCDEIRKSSKWERDIDFIKGEINRECSCFIKKFSKDILLDNFNMSSKEKYSSSLSNPKVQDEIKKTSNLFSGIGTTDDGQSFKFYR